MNILSRRIAIGLLSGAVLLAGSVAAYTVQAASTTSDTQVTANNGQKPPKPPKMDADKAAQHLADTFGVSKDEVLSYVKSNKNDFRDALHGAMLSKLSGKSFADVMALKTSSNQWSDVETTLGVSREQVKNLKDQMMASRMAKDGNISEEAAQKLLQQGYHPRDIQSAALLAKASGKDIQSVLDMKTIRNSWKDVASELKVDAKVLKQGKKGHMPPMGENGGPQAGGMQPDGQQAPPAGAPDNGGPSEE